MYFSKKKVYEVCNGVWGKALEAGQVSRIFNMLKVTLQSVRLLLTVSYRKKLGEQDVLVAPPMGQWGATVAPVPPVMSTHL